MRQSSLLIIFLIAFLDLVGFAMVLPVLPYYAQGFGAHAWELGWLLTAFTAVQFLISPFWGKLSDYFGRRLVILMTLFGTALSMALLGVSGSLQWILIARILAGGFGATLSTSYAYVTDVSVHPEERTQAYGMLQAAVALAMVFGPGLGGILSRYDLSLPFLAASVLSLLNLVFAYFKLEEPRLPSPTRAANRYHRFNFSLIRLVLEDPRTRLASALLFLCTFAISQLESVLAFYLMLRFGFSAVSTGMLLAVMGAVMVLVQFNLIQKVLRKFNPIRITLVGSIIFGIGLIGVVDTSWIGWILFFLLLLAGGQALIGPVLSSIASTGSGTGTSTQRRTSAIGVFRSFGSLARILSPPIAGWLFDQVSWRVPFFVAAGALLIAAILSLIWTLLPSKIASLIEAENNPYLEG